MKVAAKCLLVFALALLSSCVSMKKFNEQRAEALRFQGQYANAMAEIGSLNSRLAAMTSQRDALATDTLKLGGDLRQARSSYAALQQKYEKLLADGSAEAAKMLKELEKTQASLDERSRYISELEAMLRSRDEAIRGIRQKVADALVGFDGKGLTITQKNGMVYVSMDEKLLFKSGKFDIEPQGAEAIRELSKVLAANPDINVMVEGHTDDVPYRGSGQLLDNWDLSVKRATTVTRLILENKTIAPERVAAAGRGEFLPLVQGANDDARRRNRRTEIILTPKLDELMKLMESY